MNAQQLQTFLHEGISACAALQIEVVDCSPQAVVMRMPFAANHNHKNTTFGGSMALAATLCGWAMVHVRCPEAAGNIVIQESRMRYLKPGLGDLRIIARAPDEAAWEKCCEMLRRRHGKGKIELVSELWHGEVLTAEFYGKYVALAAEG